MNELLTITVDVDGDCALVTLRGEIDRSNAGHFEQRLDDAMQNGVPRIVDMSDVAYIDSAGLRALQVSAQRGPLRVVLPETARVYRTLIVTGLDDILPIVGTLADARAFDR